jgi:hypothetical protein
VLVPTAASTTTLSGAGTNGRVLVAGNLVHTGSGRMHSYPFMADADLRCGPELAHLGTLSLNVQLQDPDKVVDADRFFQGRFSCELDGKDVTPGDNSWQVKATADAKVLADNIPVGAVCTVTEQLNVPPAKGYEWAEPTFSADRVKMAKRDPRKVTITNRARELPPPPPPPTPAATLTADPDEVETPEATEEPAAPTETPASEPTVRPEPAEPSTAPPPAPTATETSSDDAEAPQADPRPPSAGPGPFTTTAPFTLRGSFVWGPLVLLSVLTLLLRVRRRPKRLH